MGARRSLLAAALALLWRGAAAAPGNPGAVRATNPWRLDLSPMTLTQGVPTNVTVTVTDASEMIGLVTVDIPAGFTVVGASVGSVPTGFVWTASVAGSGPTRVSFRTTQVSWRHNGAQGVFIVRVIATASPLPAWSVNAYKNFTVASTKLNFGPLTPPGPFTIVPAPTAPPAPTRPRAPTPPPAPTPTTKPDDTPTPTPAGIPTAGPAPTASQAGDSPGAIDSAAAGIHPNVSPVHSAAPSAASPTAGQAAETTAAGAAGVGSGGGDGTSLDVRALPAGGTVQLDSQAVGGIGMFAWMVPGLFLSLPALLLLLVFVAQGGLAMIFVPVTRRVLGAGRRRHPRGRPVLR